MNIIKPSYELLSPINREEVLKNLELAGRNCYKSEKNIDENSAGKFLKMMIAHGTESVLEHEKVTVRFICDRGVTHELVRHRLASYSQESTRYCNYGKKGGELTFIKPSWVEDEYDVNYQLWLSSMQHAEDTYLKMLECGWAPQQARSVLPNSLKTDIIMTANIREWRTIFKLRCSPKAHPQIREIMIPLYEHFKAVLPELFEDIEF